MKVIHKFKLQQNATETTLKLKLGFKIVHSEYVLVDKAIYLWVEQTLSVDVPEQEVAFRVVKSGEPLPEKFAHIATAIDSFAPEAYHIYHDPVELPQSEILREQTIDIPRLRPSAA